MEYILVSVFAIGLLLFILSWLRVIFVGFKHHPMTGLLSIIPVLNLLVLPTIWHRISGWLLAGAIGLLLAVLAWFFGAEERLYRYSTGVDNRPQQEETTESNALSLPSLTEDDAAALSSGTELPKAALYNMVYKSIELSELGKHLNEYVRISRQDRSQVEGKLLSVSNKYLILERRHNERLEELRISIDDITQAETITRE